MTALLTPIVPLGLPCPILGVTPNGTHSSTGATQIIISSSPVRGTRANRDDGYYLENTVWTLRMMWRKPLAGRFATVIVPDSHGGESRTMTASHAAGTRIRRGV
jgi:hypothetical protein